MTVADHIADLADVVDLAGTFFNNWGSSGYADILSSQWGAPDGDTEGILAALAKDVQQGTRRHFAALATAIREGADVVIRDLARTLDRSDISPNDSIQRILGIGLREWMIANSKVLKSRGVTNSSPSSVTGTGTGVLYMFSSDDQSTADELEAVTNGTIRLECITDEGGGRTAGQELFTVRDSAPSRDILELGGTAQTSVESWHSGRVTAIANADFSDDFGATASDTTKIPSWTLDNATYDPTDVTADTTNTYRGTQTVKIGGTGAILSQTFSGLPNNRPTFFGFKYNRAIGSGAGTLDMDAGSVSMSQITLAAQTGWNQAYKIAWPKRYTGGGNDIVITAAVSSGYINIAQVVIAPMVRIGGRWFIIIAGATDFLVGDYFTQQTSVSPNVRSIKDWLHRWYGFGFELPHDATPSSGWEDPT